MKDFPELLLSSIFKEEKEFVTLLLRKFQQLFSFIFYNNFYKEELLIRYAPNNGEFVIL